MKAWFKWFATRVTEKCACGPSSRVQHRRQFSSRGAVTTVVAVILGRSRSDSRTRLQDLVTVTADDDSMVASQVLGRALTTSFLLCILAIAAVAQFERRRMNFLLSRPLGNMNEEADALSNFKPAGIANDQCIEYDSRGLLRPDCGSEGKGQDQTWRRPALEERPRTTDPY